MEIAMFWLKQILLGIIGMSGGYIVAGGVFALITSVGLIARLAGKTHTGRYVKIYETCIAFGGTIGNVISVYQFSLPIGSFILPLFGIFSGIFVGVLAMSLAESVNVTAVFTRRIRLSKGIAYVILGIAIGKGLGALLLFYQGW